MFFKH